MLLSKKIILLQAFICMHLFAGTVATAASGSNLYYNKGLRYQTIVGFGGGFMFHIFPFNHPKREELYDSIFNNAQINIVRLNNWYDPQIKNDVKEIPMMLEIQQKWPQVKTMIASWSPPPYLKSNDTLAGATALLDETGALTGYLPGTLKKNGDSTYMYKEYGEYWYQSIKHFRNSGVQLDWVSIQNEPDILTNYEGCLMNPLENDTIASYGKALDAVYNACKNNFTPPVQFIGPDVSSTSGYRFANYFSPDLDKSKLSAYCHHMYDYAPSDWLEYTRITHNDKPIFQTEFLINEGKDWTNVERSWFDHAQIILRALTVERVQIYNIFALAYKPASTHTFFSLDTLGGDGFTIRPTWYMFRQFSRSIHRGWQNIESVAEDSTIESGVFMNPGQDSAAVILINTGEEPKNVYYEMPGMVGEMRQTSDSLHYQHTPQMPGTGVVTLPVRSITTLDFRLPENVIHATAALRATHRNIRCIQRKHNTIFVSYTSTGSPVTLTLYTIQGRKVAEVHRSMHSQASEQYITVNKDIAPGVYTAVLSNELGSAMKSFTVQ